MKNKAIISVLTALAFLAALGGCSDHAEEQDGCFVEQLQPRDSILIADQLRYGFRLPGLPKNTALEIVPSEDTVKTLEIVRPWQLDTLKAGKKADDIEASMVVTSFDEGTFTLPSIHVEVNREDGTTDTLFFAGSEVTYLTIPVDTATFVFHDIREQINYPFSLKAILVNNWILFTILAAVVLVAAAVLTFILVRRSRRQKAEEHKDPPHIVALRKLDQYRSDKFWAPSKQKAFYSGVTEALREYMSARYGVSAMEMTTEEIFRALKHSDIEAEMKEELKGLFVRSDFVKFAKQVATDEENSKVLPLAVRFVSTTYQEEINKENDVL